MRDATATSYRPTTPPEVRRALDRFIGGDLRRERVRVHYGDTDTGRDWGDIHDVHGYVSRSMGPIRCPILVATRASIGGPQILDDCIVRIRFANRDHGGDLYRHPTYNPPPAVDIGGDAVWRRHFR